MKNLALAMLLLLSLGEVALAQNAQPPQNKYYGIAPSKSGGGTPSGAAGGDLSGTYPNPSVAKVDGVSYPASPSANTVPVVTGTNTVTYETVPATAGGTGLASPTAHGVIIPEGSSAFNQVAGGTTCFLYWTASTSDPSCHALVAADIPSLSATYLPLSGGVMAGGINMAGAGVSNMGVFNSATGYINYQNSQTAFDIYGLTQTTFQLGNLGDSGIGMWTFNSGAGYAPRIQFGKSHSATYGSQALVSSSEDLGSINTSGSDGYNFVQSAVIDFTVDATPTAGTSTSSPGIIPGNIKFSTTNTSGSKVQALYLDSAQNIKVGPSSTKIADSTGDLFGKYGLFTGTTAPTLANGDLALYASTSQGGIVSGSGNTCDVSLMNNAAATALCVPTGTTNVNLSEALGLVRIYGFPYVDFGAGNGYGFNLYYNNGWLYAGSSDYGYALTNSGACLIVQAAPSGTAGGSAPGVYTSHQFCENGNFVAAGSGLFKGTSVPTLSNGQGYITGSSGATGGVFGGQGSTSDSCLANNAGVCALSVPTGTTNLVAAGNISTYGSISGVTTLSTQFITGLTAAASSRWSVTGFNAGVNMFTLPATNTPAIYSNSVMAQEWDGNQHPILGGSAPGTPTSCGTGSPSVTGVDAAWTITTGTSASSCTMAFHATWGATPHCVVTSSNASDIPAITALSTTSITVTLSASITTGSLYGICFQA
jgi:hypothetical protein